MHLQSDVSLLKNLRIPKMHVLQKDLVYPYTSVLHVYESLLGARSKLQRKSAIYLIKSGSDLSPTLSLWTSGVGHHLSSKLLGEKYGNCNFHLIYT